MKITKVILPVVILALSMGVASILYATKPTVDAEPVDERIWQVATTQAAFTSQQIVIKAYGTVVAARRVALSPLVAGQVLEVSPNLVSGGTVRRGDVLVRIDPFDFESEVEIQRAELANAKFKLAEITAQLNGDRGILSNEREKVSLAKRDVQRRLALQKRSVGSEKALDDARLVLKERELAALSRAQSINEAETQIDQQLARIAQLETIVAHREKDLERIAVRAPFDGFVLDSQIAQGHYAQPGESLADLIAADSLEVRFHVPLNVYSHLASVRKVIGTPANVIWRVGDSTWEFTGKVSRQTAEIDPTLGGVELYASMSEVGLDSPIRPGAFVIVNLDLGQAPGVSRLPSRAIHDDGFVFVVADDRLVKRDITVLSRAGDVTVVEGLTPGEQIVTSRFPGMAAEMAVTAISNDNMP